MENVITDGTLKNFSVKLVTDEKSGHTIEKYMRDVRLYVNFLDGREVSKEATIEFKGQLIESGKYAESSINSMLASVNSFLRYIDRPECRAANIRIQKSAYQPEDRSLGKDEYLRLREAAKEDKRLYLILETLFGTGIRISELKFFTVENLQSKCISVTCKNKTRSIIVPEDLRRRLLAYARKNDIESGVIFRTRGGNPMDRSNIWTQMKRLCQRANVAPSKVFPHNLRKLFARLFYAISKDIAQLADLLGHSSINTTRIYVMTTEREVRGRVDKLLRLLTEKRSTTLST